MFDRLLGMASSRDVHLRDRAHPAGHGASVRGIQSNSASVADAATDRALAFNPWLKVGEAYMEGKLTIEEGSLYDFIDIGMANAHPIQSRLWQRPSPSSTPGARWWHQHNPIGLARTARGAPLRSVAAAVRAVPRREHAIFLRLLHPIPA